MTETFGFLKGHLQSSQAPKHTPTRFRSSLTTLKASSHPSPLKRHSGGLKDRYHEEGILRPKYFHFFKSGTSRSEILLYFVADVETVEWRTTQFQKHRFFSTSIKRTEIIHASFASTVKINYTKCGKQNYILFAIHTNMHHISIFIEQLQPFCTCAIIYTQENRIKLAKRKYAGHKLSGIRFNAITSIAAQSFISSSSKIPSLSRPQQWGGEKEPLPRKFLQHT